MAGLWVVGVLRMERGCPLEDHPMAKSHSVDEPRSADAVERTKRQRQPKAKHKSIKAKAPKRQPRSKSAVRSRGRVKSTAARTKQQVCLDLLNRPEVRP